MEYAVVVEPTSTGFSAYVPDVPGCVAAGKTEPQVMSLIREGLGYHFEELRADGELIPQPASRLDYIESASPGNTAEATAAYAVVIEQGPTSYGAYVPDLPGCAAVAETEAEVRKLIREGVHIHLEAMRLGGESVPEPTSRIAYVDVAQAASVA